MLEELKIEIEKARKLIEESKNPNHPAIMALNALLPEKYRVKFPIE